MITSLQFVHCSDKVDKATALNDEPDTLTEWFSWDNSLTIRHHPVIFQASKEYLSLSPASSQSLIQSGRKYLQICSGFEHWSGWARRILDCWIAFLMWVDLMSSMSIVSPTRSPAKEIVLTEILEQLGLGSYGKICALLDVQSVYCCQPMSKIVPDVLCL